MRLVQEREQKTDEFESLLRRVVTSLESMPGSERLRWLELLSYIRAAVYHYRSPHEQSRMQETIEDSVQTDEHRQETVKMGITAAQALMNQGRKEGRKEGREEGREEGRKEGELSSRRRMLLKLLERRYRDVPAKTRKTIEGTSQLSLLDEWFDRALSAETLAEVGIGGRK